MEQEPHQDQNPELEAYTSPNDWVICCSGNQKKIFDYSLALSSQAIWHSLEQFDHAYHILVAPELLPKAQNTISIYRRENRGWNIIQPLTPILEDSFSRTIAILLIPSFVFLLQLSQWGASSQILWMGRCDNSLIFHGELWRIVTGWTLHLDYEHFGSNMIAGFFLIRLLLEKYSIGWVLFWGSVFASCANLLTAWVTPLPHYSAGFSSWVFVAMGWIVGSGFWEQRQRWTTTKELWKPIFAGILLFVLMGFGERVDIWAHFWGFVLGGLWGILSNRFISLAKNMLVSIILSIATLAGIASSWLLAWNRWGN